MYVVRARLESLLFVFCTAQSQSVMLCEDAGCILVFRQGKEGGQIVFVFGSFNLDSAMSSTVARSSSPRASYPEKTHSDRAMPSPLSAPPVAADDGLKAAKKQFNQPLSQLQAIFPEWKEDDLLSVLEEARGDVELAVARISEGILLPFSLQRVLTWNAQDMLNNGAM
jgi:hypothetical protein